MLLKVVLPRRRARIGQIIGVETQVTAAYHLNRGRLPPHHRRNKSITKVRYQTKIGKENEKDNNETNKKN